MSNAELYLLPLKQKKEKAVLKFSCFLVVLDHLGAEPVGAIPVGAIPVRTIPVFAIPVGAIPW